MWRTAPGQVRLRCLQCKSDALGLRALIAGDGFYWIRRQMQESSLTNVFRMRRMSRLRSIIHLPYQHHRLLPCQNVPKYQSPYPVPEYFVLQLNLPSLCCGVSASSALEAGTTLSPVAFAVCSPKASNRERVGVARSAEVMASAFDDCTGRDDGVGLVVRPHSDLKL